MKNNIRIARKVSRYIDASMNRATSIINTHCVSPIVPPPPAMFAEIWEQMTSQFDGGAPLQTADM